MTSTGLPVAAGRLAIAAAHTMHLAASIGPGDRDDDNATAALMFDKYRAFYVLL
jgi:hypothetical protein